MSRVLEDRFPTLYHDIVHVSPPSGTRGVAGRPAEQRTPKATEPTLHDVIVHVCSTHRVTDVGLMKDLTATITEFLAPPEEEKPKGRGRKADD